MMPRISIDNRDVEVPQGGTVLDAARRLGIDIPSLCHLDGIEPSTSCMLCLVKVSGRSGLVPSCATRAEEGMRVESETDEIHQVRKTGLELLLADHLGDCTAPCESTCPAHMDIPLMLRQVADGNLRDAIVTVKADIALPAVLGRVCPDLCEKGCRRGQVDSPAAICLVKRYVADVDLASDSPYIPPRRPSTGKQVAIVGAGPAGLAAAFHLLPMGHACTLFDDRDAPGGMLRTDYDEALLPHDVLDAEIGIIRELGAEFRQGIRIGSDIKLADLRRDYDAVLVAVGALDQEEFVRLGLKAARGRLQIDKQSNETNIPGVFAAGDAVQPARVVIRAVAQGKEAAVCIDQYLRGLPVVGTAKPFSVRAGRFSGDELIQLTYGVSNAERVHSRSVRGDSFPSRVFPSRARKEADRFPPRQPLPHGRGSVVRPPSQPRSKPSPTAGLTDAEARAESLRCLHCECARQDHCKLRHYGRLYGASAARYRGVRRPFERQMQHADIVYEPGKCIVCGLCVRITEQAKEPLGLTFLGRGFDVRVGVPFNESIAEGLRDVGRRCAEACPTGALALRSNACTGPDACVTCGT